MAAFETTRPTSNGFLFGGRLGALTTSLHSSFAKWNDTRATRKTLSKLSIHELDDIGLMRSDITTFRN